MGLPALKKEEEKNNIIFPGHTGEATSLQPLCGASEIPAPAVPAQNGVYSSGLGQ